MVDVLSATTGVMAEEEEDVEDDGTIVAFARSGVIDLVRIAGRTRLAREAGEISLTRIARKVTQASLRYRRNQGEMRTVIRTKGLGASRNHV